LEATSATLFGIFLISVTISSAFFVAAFFAASAVSAAASLR
jgi:hypothetical protein